MSIASSVLLALALGGMFLHSRFPLFGRIARWIIGGYVGLIAILIGALVTVAPGFYMAKELSGAIAHYQDSELASLFKRIWAAVAGILFSAVLMTAVGLMIWGPLLYVKVWFLGLCWTALMVPWGIAGVVGLRILRRIERSPKGRTSGAPLNLH